MVAGFGPPCAAAPGTPPTYDPAAETALHSSPSPPQLILVLLCDPQHEQSVIPLVAYIAPAASPRCSCAGELVVWVPHLCNTVRRAFLVDALPAGQQLCLPLGTGQSCPLALSVSACTPFSPPLFGCAGHQLPCSHCRLLGSDVQPWLRVCFGCEHPQTRLGNLHVGNVCFPSLSSLAHVLGLPI